jgi:hypothetical protein
MKTLVVIGVFGIVIAAGAYVVISAPGEPVGDRRLEKSRGSLTAAPVVPGQTRVQVVPKAEQKHEGPIANERRKAKGLFDEVGSEGFGPHIDRARGEKNVELAERSLRWLGQCSLNSELTDLLERSRGTGKLPDSVLKENLELSQRIGRACQTVTSEHQSSRAELAAIAIPTNPSVATDFLLVNVKHLTAELAPLVAKGVVLDAQSGSVDALIAIRTHGSKVGIGPVETYKFSEALRRLPSELRDKYPSSFASDWRWPWSGPSDTEKADVEPAVVAIVQRVIEQNRQ